MNIKLLSVSERYVFILILNDIIIIIIIIDANNIYYTVEPLKTPQSIQGTLPSRGRKIWPQQIFT